MFTGHVLTHATTKLPLRKDLVDAIRSRYTPNAKTSEWISSRRLHTIINNNQDKKRYDKHSYVENRKLFDHHLPMSITVQVPEHDKFQFVPLEKLCDEKKRDWILRCCPFSYGGIEGAVNENVPHYLYHGNWYCSAAGESLIGLLDIMNTSSSASSSPLWLHKYTLDEFGLIEGVDYEQGDVKTFSGMDVLGEETWFSIPPRTEVLTEAELAEINQSAFVNDFSPDQYDAIQGCLRGESSKTASKKIFFLTGPHGCGKTTVLCRVIHELRMQQGKNVLVLHTSQQKTSALEGSVCVFKLFLDETKQFRTMFPIPLELDVLVIDDIHLLTEAHLKEIDRICRETREALKHEPFGGLHVIGCGDFLQLRERRLPYSDWLCNSSWFVSTFTKLKLSTNIRCGNPNFVRKLNCLRFGAIPPLLKNVDTNNIFESIPRCYKDRVTYLCGSNKTIRKHNDEVIEAICPNPRDIFVTKSEIKRFVVSRVSTNLQTFSNWYSMPDITSKEKLWRNKPLDVSVQFAGPYVRCSSNDYINNASHEGVILPLADQSLPEQFIQSRLQKYDFESSLCLGARVVLTSDINPLLRKGLEGMVVDRNQVSGHPIVRFAPSPKTSSSSALLLPRTVEIPNVNTTLPSYLNFEIEASYIPLRPAYALSIHSAMGRTFNGLVVIDVANTNISYSWLYTALSRVREEQQVIIINSVSLQKRDDVLALNKALRRLKSSMESMQFNEYLWD
eukprot:PhF_6_TR30230/c0_g1_i1/m.44411